MLCPSHSVTCRLHGVDISASAGPQAFYQSRRHAEHRLKRHIRTIAAPQRRRISTRICAEGTALGDQLRCCGEQSAHRPLLGTTYLRHACAAAALAIALHASGPCAKAQTDAYVNALCDTNCATKLDSLDAQHTESGMQYKDIKLGKGPAPPSGFQATIDYVAMTDKGAVFDSSVDDQSKTYDVRIGTSEVCHIEVLSCNSARMCSPSCQTVAGVGEGLKGMKVGGLRRLYIPGKLSYPKGFVTERGMPNLAPRSPVVFDVQLRYVAGLEVDE